MNAYINIKERLMLHETVQESEISALINDLNVFQRSVLAYLVLVSKNQSEAEQILQILLSSDSKLYSYLCCLFPQSTVLTKLFLPKESIDNTLVKLLSHLLVGDTIGKELFSYAMNRITSGTIDNCFIGLFLIIIYCNDISEEDLFNMTLSMRDTGRVFDYRENFPDKKIIRRYPTGALSEKVALLLPGMLSAVSDKYPIISPFTVAKSLSFTGGTWSKLSVIKGFHFPMPGQETVETLKRCGVSMTVAHDCLCPVDTILYQIRGFTNTVDSVTLATASIASKQLACPADLLLLDVRYGEGAFFNKSFAQELHEKIVRILLQNNLYVKSVLTDTLQPNGSGIGNHLELCEAIVIMKNEIGMFDSRLLRDQIEIVTSFFAKLMVHYFPELTEAEWVQYGKNIIANGELISSFRKLCIAHKVPDTAIDKLLDNPYQSLGLRKIDEILSDKIGKLRFIHQKKLGNISNFLFSSRASINNDANNCLNFLLNKRIGDEVIKGEGICSVYTTFDFKLTSAQVKEIQSCFETY